MSSSMRVILSSLVLGQLALAMGCGGSGNCDPSAPNTICTIAGYGPAGAGGDEGPALKAALYTPQDTAIAPNGNVWLLDFNNYEVREIDPKGIIRTVVGTGFLGDSPDPGVPSVAANTAVFNHTPHMLFTGGYLYLAAWHNSRVKRVHLSDMMLENYAGTGKRTLYTGDDGPALMAAFDLPSSIAVAPNGDIVVMDQANQVIRRIDSSGNVHRLAGTCVVETLGGGSRKCDVGSQLTMCPNSDKTTYCTDVTNACQEPCTPGFGGDGGPALQLRMAQPYGQAADPAGRLVYDHAGNLLFADTDNNRIRKIDASGMVTTIVGTGTAGYSGEGGPATAAEINHPVDIAVADDDTIYFTDTANNCVRKVDPTGTITTVAGQCNTAGQCGSSSGCFADSSGQCQVSENACFAGDGGPPTLARLNRPYGIDLVGKKLYISDSYNNRIRVANLP